jgi:hypothetical protein
MVPLMSLWLPILLAAVVVFLASFILHMVLPFHRNDFRKLPAEDAVMEALRKFDLPPGEYMMPCAGGPKAMKDPAFLEKLKAGPRVMMTVMAGGEINMGPQFIQWFLYSILIGITAAYISGRALGPGTRYLQVFRFAGATAFFGYSLALWPMSIWYKRSWATTFRSTIDGLIYGLLTGGFFGWLWPR